MALFKMIDGKRVQLSDSEEAQVRAEWAANSARPKPVLQPTTDARLNALIKALEEADPTIGERIERALNG